MTRTVYLDYNATTPLHPRVREEMVRVLKQDLGNPSSHHGPGRRSREIVERARERVAARFGTDPGEIHFTSGGTESNNLAVHGLGDFDGPFWTTAVEHPSLLEPAKRRWRAGASGETLPVDGQGRVREESLEPLAEGDGERTGVVSIQWVNNETGSVQDVSTWGPRLRAAGMIVHTDGAQGFFRIPVIMESLGVDAATISAHKSFGPLGVGALYVRRGVVLNPLLAGGPQEHRVRPGTENIPGIHGLGVLAELAGSEDLWPEEALRERRDLLLSLLAAVSGIHIITPLARAFPNTLLIALDDVVAEALLARLAREGIAASSGSACSSGDADPSHVLVAMGVSDRRIRGAVRLSYGAATTLAELELAATTLVRAVRDLRGSTR